MSIYSLALSAPIPIFLRILEYEATQSKCHVIGQEMLYFLYDQHYTTARTGESMARAHGHLVHHLERVRPLASGAQGGEGLVYRAPHRQHHRHPRYPLSLRL